jgi:hypothetical protein
MQGKSYYFYAGVKKYYIYVCLYRKKLRRFESKESLVKVFSLRQRVHYLQFFFKYYLGEFHASGSLYLLS